MYHGVRLKNPRHQQLHQQLPPQTSHGPRQLHDPYARHPQQHVQLPVTYVHMLSGFTAEGLHLHHQ